MQLPSLSLGNTNNHLPIWFYRESNPEPMQNVTPPWSFVWLSAILLILLRLVSFLEFIECDVTFFSVGYQNTLLPNDDLDGRT